MFYYPTREEFYDEVNTIVTSKEFIREEAKKDGIPEYSAIAKQIFDEKKVTKVVMAGEPVFFNVGDPSGMIYNVSLINKDCSCGQKNICPHMLAVLVYAGVSADFALPAGVKVYPPGKDVKGSKPQHGRKHTQKKDEKVGGKKHKMKIPNIFQSKKKKAAKKSQDSDDDTDPGSDFSVHSDNDDFEDTYTNTVFEAFSDDEDVIMSSPILSQPRQSPQQGPSRMRTPSPPPPYAKVYPDLSASQPTTQATTSQPSGNNFTQIY